MNRILKERYKYTSLERLGVDFEAAMAVVDIDGGERDAFSSFYHSVAMAKDAVVTPKDGHVAEDPILRDNLDTTTESESYVSGVQIDIPANTDISGVLYLHFHYPKGSKYVIRNMIRVGVNAAVRIVVYHHAAAEPKGFVVNTLTQIEASAGAVVEMVEITETRGAYFGTILTSEHRDARVRVTTIDLDNEYLRRNQFVTLAESGAECSLSGIYTTSESQHCDNYIRMNHSKSHCTSDQLYKGVAGGESRAVFTGHIYVAEDAQKTVSLQQNHNILLSDGARINTRPQLEIYADDVKCNHGATIGRLDPDAIYYMRQRGIGLDAAKRLQLEGFVNEIVTRIPTEELQRMLVDKISERLQSL